MNTPLLLTERNGLWVVSKPSGWVVHRTNDPTIPDLLSWAKETFPDVSNIEQIAPIHRIDRATSGLVLLSPDPEIRANLGHCFANEGIKKEYRALVYGQTSPTLAINRPLEDRRRGKKLQARTDAETLETFVSCSYLAVFPQTGRKHQIRRHLQAINHAVVGEKRYKPKKFLPVPGFPGRLWLHAHRITLPDGETFEAPLSSELEAQLQLLRSL